MSEAGRSNGSGECSSSKQDIILTFQNEVGSVVDDISV